MLHVFCTPKRCKRVHCLVLKNNPNYVNFFTRMISNFSYKCSPPPPVHHIPTTCWNVSSALFLRLKFKKNIFALRRSILCVGIQRYGPFLYLQRVEMYPVHCFFVKLKYFSIGRYYLKIASHQTPVYVTERFADSLCPVA